MDYQKYMDYPAQQEHNLGDINKFWRELQLGHEFKVGDRYFTQYAAPGTGHCTYDITRIDDDGNFWGVVIEDTLRMLTERDVR